MYWLKNYQVAKYDPRFLSKFQKLLFTQEITILRDLIDFLLLGFINRSDLRGYYKLYLEISYLDI